MVTVKNCCPLWYCYNENCVTCNLYLSGQLARLVLKVIMENDKKFMEVILHITFTGRLVNLIYSFKDFLVLYE
jgi:hypothetical protein